MGNILGDLLHVPRGRLTLESGVAVSTSDQTAKTTIYFTPYRGNTVPIYDTSASVWTILEFSEISLSLTGFTADKNSDVFVYNNAGTLAMERVEWTNDTTRATAITLQDGRYVKSGDASRLYVGTFRTTGTTGQCEDSLTKRLVWNYYNRVARRLHVADTTSHAYGTATWRSWNNDATIRLGVVIGVQEQPIWFGLQTNVTSGASGQPAVGVGYDVTNNNIGLDTQVRVVETTTSVWRSVPFSHFTGLGYHFYQIVEQDVNGISSTLQRAYLTGSVMG